MKNSNHIIGYPLAIIIAIVLTLLLKGCEKTEKDPYAPNDEPNALITLDEVNELYNAYNQRAELINGYERQFIPDFNAVRSTTFKYQEIKNYLKLIEKNSLEANVKISGLRFYFGKYPNDTIPKKRGRQLLFFNPTVDTILNGKKTALAYAIERRPKDTRIKLFKDIFPEVDTLETGGERIPQKNEASLLSFFNSNFQFKVESQAKQGGGQQSPPPYAIH